MAFEHGNKVTWTSQAAGFATTKTGTIVEVVSAGSLPAPEHAAYGLRAGAHMVLPRKHESYVVHVEGAKKPLSTKAAKGKRYWPVVSLLKPSN